METDSSSEDVPLISRARTKRVTRVVEEAEDDDQEAYVAQNGANTENGNGAANGKETEGGAHNDDEDDDDLPLALRVPASRLKKKKGGKAPKLPTPSKAPKVSRAREGGVAKKRKSEGTVKAKFEMAGQKRETPPKNDPARLFYESMFHEKIRLGKPSELAETWMVRHGLGSAVKTEPGA